MACPFCLSRESTPSYLPSTYFNDKLFNYVTCNTCDLIYIDPVPGQDDLLKMYPPSYQSGINPRILSDPFEKLPGLRFSYGKQFELLKKYTAGISILDHGCGQANFLLNANHAQFRCDGTEYNPIHVDLLKKSIPQSTFYLVDEFLEKETRKYDIVRLSNVLEHLEDPKGVIKKIMMKLNTEGLLLIEGPIETNFSLALVFRKMYFKFKKMIQPGWFATHPPTHLLFSNAKNQRALFKDLGMEELHFEVTESEWPFPERFTDVRSPGALFKYCVAKSSIALSRLSPASWGNTFIYIGRKGQKN